MTPAECLREAEVVRVVASLGGIEGANIELRSHVEACPVCADVVMLASLLRTERDDALREVHVPAAGQIWWRAALRAHAEALDTARRPLVWLQGIGAACAVALIVAVMSTLWPWMYDAAAAVRLVDAVPLIDALRPIMPIAVSVLACLVVAPIIVYFALSDD